MRAWALSEGRVMIRLCLVGGLGRMGRAVTRLAAGEDDFEVVSVLESEETVRSAAGPRVTGRLSSLRARA